MITLTTPIQIPSELGSAATTAYNKLRIISINADPVSLTINAQVQVMVSSNLSAPIIGGNLSITAMGAAPIVTLQIPTINFYSSFALTGTNLTTVQGWITGLQNNIESGLVSIALVAGTQAAGV